MNNIQIPIEWVLLGFSAVLLILPYLLLWNEDKVSVEQLKVLHPQAVWVTWAHPLLSAVWVILILLGSLGVLPVNLEGLPQRQVLLGAAVLVMAVETLNGALTAASGVYTLSRRRRMGSTRYVVSERARLVGLVQMGLDAAMIAAIFFLGW